MANGYVLPEGKITPNTLFVGGIDMKVDENEIRDFFARYGAVKEVKIITYRGGICKGYGFVSFNEDVDIQTIVEQQISFKGRKLKLGPAIMKERSSRSFQSHVLGPPNWMSPSQYTYCSCCTQVMGNVIQPSAVMNTGSQYMQPYTYSALPGVTLPQVPMGYTQTAYAYQYAAPQWPGEPRARIINQIHVQGTGWGLHPGWDTKCIAGCRDPAIQNARGGAGKAYRLMQHLDCRQETPGFRILVNAKGQSFDNYRI